MIVEQRRILSFSLFLSSPSKEDKQSFKDLFFSFRDLFSSRVERSADSNSAFEVVPPFKSFAFTLTPKAKCMGLLPIISQIGLLPI